MSESPAFTRTHDLLLWLVQVTRKFPRDQRFVMAARLHECGFALQEKLAAAAIDKAHTARHLIAADIQLNLMRKRLLLCRDAGLLSAGQYRHASDLTQQIGNLLGTWRKKE